MVIGSEVLNEERRLSFGHLRELQVHLDGRLLDLGRRLQRQLLAILLVEGGPFWWAWRCGWAGAPRRYVTPRLVFPWRHGPKPGTGPIARPRSSTPPARN
jgi:hypothetical protein